VFKLDMLHMRMPKSPGMCTYTHAHTQACTPTDTNIFVFIHGCRYVCLGHSKIVCSNDSILWV